MPTRMKLLRLSHLFVALVGACSCIGCGGHSQRSSEATEDNSPSGFAVVELFTSESCSSCPPADALVNRLADEAQKNKSPICCLAFHVDYFNRLGWVDKLSDVAYTRRQEWYGTIYNNAEIYTPMMIVNGGEPFLGYDETTVRKQIRQALNRPAADQISLTVREHLPDRGLHVDYAVKGTMSGELIHIAVIESGVGKKISGGENAGKYLFHDCVVRIFKTEPVGAGGTGSVNFQPIKLAGGKFDSVIAFQQDQKNGHITGAARCLWPADNRRQFIVQRIASTDCPGIGSRAAGARPALSVFPECWRSTPAPRERAAARSKTSPVAEGQNDYDS